MIQPPETFPFFFPLSRSGGELCGLSPLMLCPHSGHTTEFSGISFPHCGQIFTAIPLPPYPHQSRSAANPGSRSERAKIHHNYIIFDLFPQQVQTSFFGWAAVIFHRKENILHPV
jgi:hypothetical protein